jgi:glycosyltransferase involved in cell wall biosynthesis
MISSDDVAHDIPANLARRAEYVGSMTESDTIRGRNRYLRLVRHVWRCDVLVGALELKPHLVAVFLGTVLRKPVVLWLHKDLGPFLVTKKPWVRWVYQRLLGANVRLARKVVTVSDGVAGSLISILPTAQKKTVCVHNPIDFSAIDEVMKSTQLEACDNVDFILAVGRFTWQKGFDVLLNAFHVVSAQVPNLKLVILGDGELRDELERKIVTLGLQGRVEMPGFQPPYRLMASARLLVTSSRFEGLPTVLIEGLYCGARIVATDCPSGPADILCAGRHGALVPVDTPDELASTIVAALRAPDTDERRAARRRRALDFSFESTIPKWQALLAECR